MGWARILEGVVSRPRQHGKTRLVEHWRNRTGGSRLEKLKSALEKSKIPYTTEYDEEGAILVIWGTEEERRKAEYAIQKSAKEADAFIEKPIGAQ